MNKPNTLESVEPCSGQYSLRADLKLNAWLFVATLLWCVSLYVRRTHADLSVVLRVAWSLAPLVPGLLYVRSCMRFVRGLDELQRRIQLEAFLFAALGTLLVGTVVNVLSADGVVWTGREHGLQLGETFGLMFVLWAVGYGIAKCRYK